MRFVCDLQPLFMSVTSRNIRNYLGMYLDVFLHENPVTALG